jgi:ubiquinone/menaquinone biosynthesis C-methylase UbiE
MPDSTPNVSVSSSSQPQHGITQPATQYAQNSHRTNLINMWSIPRKSQIIEIGCGQGDCTEVLALAIGPEGHIDAIDPAPLDYGSPETLGEAQARLSQSAFGSQISWHQATPVEFLASAKEGAYGVAVLCHSIWYFSSPGVVLNTLRALKGKAEKLCIAEYSLCASEVRAIPHVLAALARGSLEAHKVVSEENIRTALAPDAIRRIAEEAGWKLVMEKTIVPEEGLEDGRWETNTVVDEGFLKEVENVKEEKVKVVLRSMREAVKGAVRSLGGKTVRTMDVWVASYE